MKKSNTPTPINENEKEMNKIVHDMAVLFEKKISASTLAKWLALANAHSDPNDDLIWFLGYTILPGLIDAQNQADRISFLKKELPKALNIYEHANRSLFQIGSDFLLKNKGLFYSMESIDEFMEPYFTLLKVCEVFQPYERFEIEFEKTKKNLITSA